jgi:hypothetical protein
LNVLPHVTANDRNRASNLDRRTTRQPGYAISLSRRWLIEKSFAWLKQTGPLRQAKLRGQGKVDWLFVFSCAADNRSASEADVHCTGWVILAPPAQFAPRCRSCIAASYGLKPDREVETSAPTKPAAPNFNKLLVLLCHKKSRRQQGHLGRERARCAVSWQRRLAMEYGLGRSVRAGSAAGRVAAFGIGRERRRSAARSDPPGGEKTPLLHQEAVSGDGERCMVNPSRWQRSTVAYSMVNVTRPANTQIVELVMRKGEGESEEGTGRAPCSLIVPSPISTDRVSC